MVSLVRLTSKVNGSVPNALFCLGTISINQGVGKSKRHPEGASKTGWKDAMENIPTLSATTLRLGVRQVGFRHRQVALCLESRLLVLGLARSESSPNMRHWASFWIESSV